MWQDESVRSIGARAIALPLRCVLSPGMYGEFLKVTEDRMEKGEKVDSVGLRSLDPL